MQIVYFRHVVLLDILSICFHCANWVQALKFCLDDFFVTPSSTPTNEKEQEPEKEMDEKADANSENLTDASLRSRIYDRYRLTISIRWL